MTSSMKRPRLLGAVISSLLFATFTLFSQDTEPTPPQPTAPTDKPKHVDASRPVVKEKIWVIEFPDLCPLGGRKKRSPVFRCIRYLRQVFALRNHFYPHGLPIPFTDVQRDSLSLVRF